MSESRSIAAVVVLYNPEDNVFENVQSYVGQVSKIYVVDNSVQYNTSLLDKLKSFNNVVYIDNHGNRGIANALNRGCEAAIKDDIHLLLTMDQDTKLTADFVKNLADGLKHYGLNTIGIIAPRYTTRDKAGQKDFDEVLWTMTSGNILDVHIYQLVGPFMDELFIDHVDHEYCLRLNSKGFKVIQSNKVEILHRPGREIAISFGWKTKLVSSHSPTRLYYFCRNGFFVSALYLKAFPQFRSFFYSLLWKEIAKILFEDQKVLRANMILKGRRDYVNHKMGALKS